MDGKVVVVTGALGALGSVVVDEALARGARIASVDHAPTQAPATADLFELGGVDLVGEQAKDRVRRGRHADELVVREAALAVRLDQLVPGFDQRIHSTGEPACDQDARQTRCQCSR